MNTTQPKELVQRFLAADRKVTRIEESGGVWVEGYGKTGTSKEYDEALLHAQELYAELEAQGINPFE
ncbi:hypothetical protein [Arsenicibacter rosenii]|uniref:Uncharacterized protein n=1 Tax=Arsenicibacter rosenii TaxID=1750698 RepID=A0A1S2VAX1_9BACT|nr:hypothetical protein [Arsenicibacter rosenii]OIN55842.1 hypothetical protein BLX24_27690 [Arsenicibacter rosenii]